MTYEPMHSPQEHSARVME